MVNIFEYLKANYQFALVAFGIVIIIGSILRWNWLLNPSGKMKNSLICSVIIEKMGRKRSERFKYFLWNFVNHMRRGVFSCSIDRR